VARIQFSRIRFQHNVLALIRCEVEWDGFQGVGFGDSFSVTRARIKAQGEAWERLWLSKLAQERNIDLSSNGFAAGKTEIDAKNAARLELIERAALLEVWTKKFRWKLIRVPRLNHTLDQLLLRIWGWNLEIFEILSQDEIYVLAGLATHPDRGSVFDTCAGRSHKELMGKVVNSLVRQVLLNAAQTEPKHLTVESLPERATPADHASFYANPAHNIAFERIRRSDHLPASRLVRLDDIQIQTLPPPPGAPCVARATHPDWPQLTWGKQSIQGDNPYPHPLA
jgi:hypothetical protein